MTKIHVSADSIALEIRSVNEERDTFTLHQSDPWQEDVRFDFAPGAYDPDLDDFEVPSMVVFYMVPKDTPWSELVPGFCFTLTHSSLVRV